MDPSERQAHAEATYTKLFGPRAAGAPDDDPELEGRSCGDSSSATSSTPACSATRPAS